ARSRDRGAGAFRPRARAARSPGNRRRGADARYRHGARPRRPRRFPAPADTDALPDLPPPAPAPDLPRAAPRSGRSRPPSSPCAEAAMSRGRPGWLCRGRRRGAAGSGGGPCSGRASNAKARGVLPPAPVTLSREQDSGTPDIDDGEQEQPDDVDEVPVPGRGLEPDVFLRREVSGIGPVEADDQEDRADDDVKAMEARRHEEVGAVDVAGEAEGGVAVLVGLEDREQDAEADAEPEAPFEMIAVVLVDERVVRPGHRAAGAEQDEGVAERQVPGVEGL